MIKIYGGPGYGSAIAELMLTMAEQPYHYIDVDGFDKPGVARTKLEKLNPLCQVPTLQLPDGTIITETAAIALMLLETRPDLAPPPETREKQQFFRLLIWFVSSVYPTFTYADYPERWAPQSKTEWVTNIEHHRCTLYRWLETQLGEGPYTFSQQLTLLDAYWPVVCCWHPRVEWFIHNTPKLWAIALKVAHREELVPVIQANALTISAYL